MQVTHKKKRKEYQLIYKTGLREVTDYSITEEEYFDYYQNSCDPTFVNYNWKKLEFVTTDVISYYSTVFNLLLQGKKLTVLDWQDFKNFIAEWLLFKGWCVSLITKPQNGGINITTTKRLDNTTDIKCIWITKKYASNRPVGVRIVRELDYLISKSGASIGAIVTTSRLTKGALKLIEENHYTMFYIDNQMLEHEFQNLKSDEIAEIDELPF